MKTDDQIIKCRDDKAPVVLSKAPDTGDGRTLFKLADGSECSWFKKEDTFGPEKLRPRIEPWLTALFQSEHFALLVGSGLTTAVHRIATGKSVSGMSPVTFTHFDTEISSEAKKSCFFQVVRVVTLKTRFALQMNCCVDSKLWPEATRIDRRKRRALRKTLYEFLEILRPPFLNAKTNS
jgi:hypothetical protein